jgi:hypothetical protein
MSVTASCISRTWLTWIDPMKRFRTGVTDVKKICLVALMFWGAALATGVHGFENKNTTLKNEDSKTYEYSIKTTDGGIIADEELLEDNTVIYNSGVSYSKIDSHSQVAICNFGCELTLTETGQTITIKPGDTVVIDKGVLKVR